jgi:hypothetical protein
MHQDINYRDKINTFQTITENYDEELAIQFLENADWDEIVNKY